MSKTQKELLKKKQVLKEKSLNAWQEDLRG